MFFTIGLVEDFINPSLYELKAPYHMEAEGIVVHNTWNDASAKAERNYMINNPKPTGFHIVVDDKEALQLIPFDRNAYHCGNGYGNRNYIGLEICYSKSGGEKFEKAEDNAIKIVANILLENNWDTDNVKFHKDFASKNCPNLTDTDEFIKEVESELDSLKENQKYKIANKPTASLASIEDWAKKNNASKTYLDLLPYIYSESQEYGIDPVVVSVQCALETGFIKKGNSQSGGHNPAGIKSGRKYARYDSWEDGITAQIKLLAKYAGISGNKYSWLYGRCKYVEGLAGLWAEDKQYSVKLLKMIDGIEKNEYVGFTEENPSKTEEIKKEVLSLVDSLKTKKRKLSSRGKDVINKILNKK